MYEQFEPVWGRLAMYEQFEPDFTSKIWLVVADDYGMWKPPKFI